MSRTLRIATRKSPLALWQAEHVKARLQQLHPGLAVELVGMTTRGDKILDAPLAKVGGKGLFVKELEHALLNHEADIAVHSMKDVPMEFPDGLTLGVICEREDPRDAFVSNRFAALDELPQGAVVGTSSLRRACQLKSARPDLVIESLRGNVNSRLAKLDGGDFDAIILASAGLIRLGLTARIRNAIAPEVILPAGGQGAIGIELRSNDDTTRALIAPLHHSDSADRVICERALNRHLQGGCQVPIAAYAIKEGAQLWLRALVGDPDGSETLRAELRGEARDAQALGISVADELKAQGADRILAAVYGSDYGFG